MQVLAPNYFFGDTLKKSNNTILILSYTCGEVSRMSVQRLWRKLIGNKLPANHNGRFLCRPERVTLIK